MGNSDSKYQDSEVKQLGDQQVTLIENQQKNTEYHTQHDFKLWIILTVTITLLVMKVLKVMCKYCKKQALKAAKSVKQVEKV